LLLCMGKSRLAEHARRDRVGDHEFGRRVGLAKLAGFAFAAKGELDVLDLALLGRR